MIKPEIKEAVKVLYVDKGYTPGEIASLTGIDHSTIYDWINNNRWRDERINKQYKLTTDALKNIPVKQHGALSIQSKKIQLKILIKQKGYNQKEAAKLAGVSEKTASKWCKKYKWKTNCKIK